MAGTRIIEQWFKGYFGRPNSEFERLMDERLLELERTLGEWYQALRFGNIPGGYMMLQWKSLESPTATFNEDAVVLPPVTTAGEGAFEMRPIAVGAACSGDVTFNLVDPEGNDILVADAQAAPFYSTNFRRDFAVEKIVSPPGSPTPAIVLNIRAVADSSRLSVNMIVKGVSQVEP